MDGDLDGFERQFRHISEMAEAYVAAVPDERWQFSPHPRFAPFAKQLRHVVCVRGVYAAGFAEGRVDFARKHEHYRGDLLRASLTAALASSTDALLDAALGAHERGGAGIEFPFLGRTLPLDEFTYVIVQHDSMHLGEWSVYAALAGFQTPASWRLNWDL
jgi:hypothetical protein